MENSKCPTPTLYMKGYDCDSKPRRPAPKFRATKDKERKSAKRKQSYSADQGPSNNLPLVEEEILLLGENYDFEYPATLSPASTADSTDTISKIDVATQTEYRSPEKEKREYFIDQAACPKNCYRYTGVTRSKLELLFEFLEPKATDIRIWRGSKNTKRSSKKRATEVKKKKILLMMES